LGSLHIASWNGAYWQDNAAVDVTSLVKAVQITAIEQKTKNYWRCAMAIFVEKLSAL